MPLSHATALPALSEEIRKRLETPGELPPRLERPNLPATRESVVLFRRVLHALSLRADLAHALVEAVDLGALYGSFDAFLLFRAGQPAAASSALLDAWASAASGELRDLESATAEMQSFVTAVRKQLEGVQEAVAEGLSAAKGALSGSPEHGEWLVVFHQAVEQVVASELGADQARAALRSLMTRLDLSQDDLGRMFRVSGETVRRWERGLSTIPAARGAEILAAESGLRRLQDLFRPERLPTAVRRAAELFAGESALEWILRGRIADVADRYEQALLYQA